MEVNDLGAVAAVDCGTNSTRLLIVDSSGRTVAREMRITRLGQGVDATHALASEAMVRTLEVLRHFRVLMNDAHVGRVRMVATSAVRDATNGDEFLKAASDVIGAEAELIPGAEEGRLAYTGATRDLNTGDADVVVVDIGGGSTELVTERDGDIHSFSMALGCVRLSERYLHHDPPSADELSAMVVEIQRELLCATKALPVLEELRARRQLIGLAGTVSTLAALEIGLVEYQPNRVHHAVLTQQAVAHWCQALAAEQASERAARPGMLDGRQDVIVGGAVVLREVMSGLGFLSCLVSEADILDGLILSIRDAPA
jgi:exopolyphosphatase/guanosine-5'-triphosphate,3'-diphosphate pyrophosphatase